MSRGGLIYADQSWLQPSTRRRWSFSSSPAALDDGEPIPEGLADAVAGLATAVGAVTRELGVDGDRERARRPILDVVQRAPVLAEDPDRPRSPTSAVLVAQVRSIAVDLLQATGLDREEALRSLRDRL